MPREVDDGQTPIDPNEAVGLLIPVLTQEALNLAEEENILRARLWAVRSRLVRGELLTSKVLCRIHREMFRGVWSWAGKYRKTDKNFGSAWRQVPTAVHQLCGDFAYRIDHGSEDTDLVAVEFHHRLVSIHPFPNGNGRHARFCADRLIENLGAKAFSWGRSELRTHGDARRRYIAALQAADSGDITPLVEFARSRDSLFDDPGVQPE